eukprot:scaffold664446_cov36-Prasinocladus_malaysianus.AAC.1
MIAKAKGMACWVFLQVKQCKCTNLKNREGSAGCHKYNLKCTSAMANFSHVLLPSAGFMNDNLMSWAVYDLFCSSLAH